MPSKTGKTVKKDRFGFPMNRPLLRSRCVQSVQIQPTLRTSDAPPPVAKGSYSPAMSGQAMPLDASPCPLERVHPDVEMKVTVTGAQRSIVKLMELLSHSLPPSCEARLSFANLPGN